MKRSRHKEREIYEKLGTLDDYHRLRLSKEERKILEKIPNTNPNKDKRGIS